MVTLQLRQLGIIIFMCDVFMLICVEINKILVLLILVLLILVLLIPGE